MEIVTKEEGQRIEKSHVCSACGGRITLAWGGAFGIPAWVVRCGRDPRHEGIERPHHFHPADIPGFNLYDTGKKRRRELENTIGAEKTRSLQKYENAVTLRQEEATEILLTIWPKAPQIEVKKAAIICHQYGLNPLMKHIFLVPFNRYNERHEVIGTDWEVIIALRSTRLIAARRGRWSYLDDTPRLMTEEEQKRIFGELNTTSLVAIVKLKDMATGATATGYGTWPRSKSVKGEDKGNSRANMAFIRAERRALDMLYPECLPADVEVMDERFVETRMDAEVRDGAVASDSCGMTVDTETGEVVEGECRLMSGTDESEKTSVEPLGGTATAQGKGEAVTEVLEDKEVKKNVANIAAAAAAARPIDLKEVYSLASLYYKMNPLKVANIMGYTTVTDLAQYEKATPADICQTIVKLES
jgi:hypothetical protein